MQTQMSLLSDAAVTTLRVSIDYLFRQAVKRGHIRPETVGNTGCGWTVLALGKLGAGELNFSSDIDLIMLHDSANSPVCDKEAIQPFFVRMTRDLIRLLGTPTSDGIGWRVDLRLRPDPGATAVSIDIDAAIGYYESLARTWERAAFIRARAVAGDCTLGERFLGQIQPLIWRRTLDYTVMEDMKTMLRRPPQGTGWLGFNLKTGKNGIRQIEFFTHVLQLVAGGRDASLRQPSTMPALAALAAKQWIDTSQANDLTECYFQLRRTEHRLQMLGDSQTHSLPRSAADLEKFARFMGHETSEGFLHSLAALMDDIADKTQHELLNSADKTVSGSSKHQLLLEDTDAVASWLETMGFSRPKIIADTLSGWMAGRIPATRGERARDLLNRLMPDMLSHFATANDPDEKFAALAQFIEGLPASVQIFSLLDYNRHLTKLLCDMLVLSPHLSRYLQRNPLLFDLLLYSSFFKPLPDADSMTEILRSRIAEKAVEMALDTVKTQVNEWKFQVQVQALSQTIDSATLGASLTAIATATVRTVFDLARQDMQRRHGAIKGRASIIALGRLGTGQMTVRSDLDLIILFDADETSMSDGDRTLGAASYFTRLAQTMTSWLSTPTAEGTLYPVDLRLRPEGEAGGIATSLSRFTTYFATDAWLWEKMALTKARVIAGDEALSRLAQETASGIANRGVPLQEITTAIDKMLKRLHAARKAKTCWHLRALDGGLTDLDLLIQGYRLCHGDQFSRTGQSQQQILHHLRAYDHIDDGTFERLSHACSIQNEVHQCLRLTFGSGAAAGDILPAPLAHFMRERLDLADADQLAFMVKSSRSDVTTAMDEFLSTGRKSTDKSQQC